MKKLLSSILVLVMLLALVGCSSKTASEDAGSDDSAKVAYIIAEKGDTYSQGLASSFRDAWVSLGGVVASGDVVSFPAGTTNFSDYIQSAMDSDAAVIFCPNSTTVAANFLSNADDLGVECPILAGDTWESSVILDAVKGTELEVYCSTFFDENDTSGAAQEFVTGFKAWLAANSDKFEMNGGNDIVAAVSALGFDAYNVAYTAIEAAAAKKGAELTSIDVAEALCELEYTGAVTGSIMFDATGDAVKDTAYIKKAGNGAFEFAKVQTVANDAVKGDVKDYSSMPSVALNTASKEIVIGVYEPTSGDNGAGGKQEVIGIQYANSLKPTMEIAGETYTVKVLVSDNGSKEDQAVTAASAIVNAGAIVSLGSYGSGVSIAAAPTFEAAGIPAIGISCTNAAVTDGHDLYFRTCFLDPFQGSVMAGFAAELVK